MSEELFTGVEMQDDPAAGDQQEEEDIFGLEDTGEEETQEDAASEEAETGAFEDESTEKAFAARLRKEREKIAQETEERLRQEYEAKYQQIQQQQQTQQQQYIPPQAPPPLPRQQLEDLADQLGVTIETANAMYHQQWLINQQNEAIRRQEEYLRRMADNTSKSEALKAIEQRRKVNPNLPEPDETRLQQIRQEYKGKYGYDLPWEEAYEKLVAQEAISGNLTRTAQQRVINDITARGRKTVQAGKGGRAKKPSIEDMSKEDFEALVEQAKAGKFKRT